MSQRPTCDEKQNFLLLAYFGAVGDQTDRFISRAYRDMNRTLHGLSKRENAKELVQNAEKDLRNSLCKLQRLRVPNIPDERIAAFDQWHRCACAGLIGCFLPFQCYYGQAQKWINMTIKYCWFFRDESELEAWYPIAHVPVDEFILRAAKEAGVNRPCEKWSRWDNPNEYEEFQKLIRNEADELGKTPLALEHDWWMEEAAKP